MITVVKTNQQRGKSAKRKGNQGELDIKKFLEEELGIKARYTRSVQAEKGGFDLIILHQDNLFYSGLENHAIEVKNQATVCIDAWWKEAIKNCTENHPIPMLFWKDRRKWKVRFGLTFMPIHSYREHYMDVSLQTFAFMCREGWFKQRQEENSESKVLFFRREQNG